jgi:hypothetical protein
MVFCERTPILTTGKAGISTHPVRPTWAILLKTFPNPFSAASGAPEAQGPDGFDGGEHIKILIKNWVPVFGWSKPEDHSGYL